MRKPRATNGQIRVGRTGATPPVSAAPTPAAPETIGRYQLCFELASGGMASVYLARAAGSPGFEKLVVARDVTDPLTIVTMSWWESHAAADAWTKSQGYREAKGQSGGQGLRAEMEFGRWSPAD